MVGAVSLEQSRAADVLGEVAAVADADERVVAIVDDERRNVDEREHVADVELEDGLEAAHERARGRSVALDPRPPLDDPGPARRPTAPSTWPKRPVPQCSSICSPYSSCTCGGMPAG